MKKIISISAITGFVIIAVFGAFKSAVEKATTFNYKEPDAMGYILCSTTYTTQPVKYSLALLQNDAHKLWKRFKLDSEIKINNNKKRIAALKIDIANGTDDVKTRYQKDINELERKNDNLQSSLADYRDDTKVKLDNFKIKVNNDLNDIAASLQKIKL